MSQGFTCPYCGCVDTHADDCGYYVSPPIKRIAVSNPKLSVYGKYEQACARIRELEAEDIKSAKEIDGYRSSCDAHLSRITHLEAAIRQACSDMGCFCESDPPDGSCPMHRLEAALAPKEPTAMDRGGEHG